MGSVIAGLLTAFFITWLQQTVQTKSDAVIGIVFTFMFSVGVIGISAIARQGVHLDLKDFLFGNVLGVSDEDIWTSFGVMIAVVASVIILYRPLFASTFQPTIAMTMGIPVKWVHYYLMLLLSFAVVAAMQTVGVILVVAMLITPASSALLLHRRLPAVIISSAIIGLIVSVAGLILSILYEMPPGPAIAVTAAFVYVLTVLLAPEKGLLFKWLKKLKQERRILGEDVLKAIYKNSVQHTITLKTLREKIGLTSSRLGQQLQRLLKDGLVTKEKNGNITLTSEGVQQANDLIRAHRLWESYLVQEIGLGADQIHEEAERVEHLLTSDQVDQVDRHLGYPALDPHGAPIPTREKTPKVSMDQLQPDEYGRIMARQPAVDIPQLLWDLGLGPGELFRIISRDQDLVIEAEGKSIAIPRDLAHRVSVERQPA